MLSQLASASLVALWAEATVQDKDARACLSAWWGQSYSDASCNRTLRKLTGVGLYIALHCVYCSPESELRSNVDSVTSEEEFCDNHGLSVLTEHSMVFISIKRLPVPSYWFCFRRRHQKNCMRVSNPMLLWWGTRDAMCSPGMLTLWSQSGKRWEGWS